MSSWQELPEQLRERLMAIVPEDKHEQVQSALLTGRPTTLRVNRLLAEVAPVVAALESDGFQLEPVPWYPEAFILRSKTIGELTEHPIYTAGKIYVQGLSSMVPVLAMQPQPGDQVLDVAAAPGSKTTQMAVKMGNEGTIIANDISRIRLYKLAANLKMQGVTNVQTFQGQGHDLWRKLAPIFDKALVDVPCSMEGRIRVDRLKTYDRWSLKKIKELAQRQKGLLRSAITLTKPGGVIVYSTCTLAPEENEGVIDEIVRRLPNQVAVEPIDIPGLELDAPLSAWQNQTYDPSVSHTRRIFPSATMEGFFVAKLRRL